MADQSDAQWLIEQSENLVAYEEDAQRMRRIARGIAELNEALIEAGSIADLVRVGINDLQSRRSAMEACDALIEHLAKIGGAA